MDFKSRRTDLKIGGTKSDKQINEIKNIVNLYDTRGEAIKFYKDFSTKMHNARYDGTHGKGLKISLLKKILQKLLIGLAQIKAGNTSENLLNEIHQIIYSLYQAKDIIKKYIII